MFLWDDDVSNTPARVVFSKREVAATAPDVIVDDKKKAAEQKPVENQGNDRSMLVTKKKEHQLHLQNVNSTNMYYYRNNNNVGSLPFNQFDKNDNLFQVLPTDSVMNKDPKQWDMSPIVVEELQLLFFTVPKVACTTFKQLFRRIKGAKKWQSQNFKRMLPHNPQFNGLIYLSHFNTSFARKIFLDPAWTKAIFLREPKKRFLSAYLDKAVANNGDFIRDKCCATLGTRGRCQFNETCRQCVHNGIKHLEGFLNLIQTCKDAHWESQYNRMEPKYWRYINFIGKMENMAKDGEKLLKRVGAWEKYGRSGWGKFSNASMLDRPTGQNHISNSESKAHWHYTPELERQVEQYYFQDFINPLFQFEFKNISKS